MALKVASLTTGFDSERWSTGKDLPPIFFQDLEELQNQIQNAFFNAYGDTSYQGKALVADAKQNSLSILQAAIGNFLTTCTLYQDLEKQRVPEEARVLSASALAASVDLLRAQLQTVHIWIADFDQNKIGYVLKLELKELATPSRDSTEIELS